MMSRRLRTPRCKCKVLSSNYKNEIKNTHSTRLTSFNSPTLFLDFVGFVVRWSSEAFDRLGATSRKQAHAGIWSELFASVCHNSRGTLVDPGCTDETRSGQPTAKSEGGEVGIGIGIGHEGD